MSISSSPSILVLGASGLIGRFITDDLRRRGRHVVGLARRFSASQRVNTSDIELPILSLDAAALTRLMREHEIGMVVNCLGVLQDGLGSATGAVHRDFVARLLAALKDAGQTIRLVHDSKPGTAGEDCTAFSTTKREAERLIAASSVPYAILRPGFVIAPSAYGGSAMVRSLAALPFELPAKERARPFQPVAVEDVASTVAWLAARPLDDASSRAVTWDLMQPAAVTLGDVIDCFRAAFGAAQLPRITLPAPLLAAG